ncbi:hypothetical protein A9K55_000302 [Cordyceps militaris]|uniref:Uncharacterized protein n=1 Tax=Cordyceps militaris TaxID=73501 RepID=A0A2H4SWA0_CORMI|nr:hypothetical protein A9K55_000302 [Cordyceps militaris]
MVVGENEKKRILGEWDGWTIWVDGWAEQRFGKDVPCGAAGQALTIVRGLGGLGDGAQGRRCKIPRRHCHGYRGDD